MTHVELASKGLVSWTQIWDSGRQGMGRDSAILEA